MCHQSLAYYLSEEAGISFNEIKNFLDRPLSNEKETLSTEIKKKADLIYQKLKNIKSLIQPVVVGLFWWGCFMRF
jgi:hypothetical protein